MGDPKKTRKKYQTPSHPWQKGRIEEEKELAREYGTKSKTELWKMNSKLRGFLRMAKHLIALRTAQAEKEKAQLIARLAKLGLIPDNASLDDILDLKIKNILERRLQTLLVRKGFARTMSQARQYITHHHVTIGPKKVTSPSHLVTVKEEGLIAFYSGSGLASMDHPERFDPDEERKRQEIIKKKTDERKERMEQRDSRFGRRRGGRQGGRPGQRFGGQRQGPGGRGRPQQRRN